LFREQAMAPQGAGGVISSNAETGRPVRSRALSACPRNLDDPLRSGYDARQRSLRLDKMVETPASGARSGRRPLAVKRAICVIAHALLHRSARDYLARSQAQT